MIQAAGRLPLVARMAGACVLGACLLWFAATTFHWPLAGDAALMHYVAFLMDHGRVPYRDIAEMNMPGAFLVDDAVMHTLGPGSLAWRIFDLLLMAVATAAMIAIARPKDWFAGLFAGALLGLIHGRDGVFDLGQRDFVAAVLLVAGCAALFRATRRASPGWMFLFGLCAGAAGSIKPPLLLLGPAVVVLLLVVRPTTPRGPGTFLLYAAAGWALPLVAIAVWLWHAHALHSLFFVTSGLVRYHAGLAHRPLGYLLLHAFSPLLPLVLLWLMLVPLQRENWRSWERFALLLSAAIGLLSWLIQAKGYPYQRYPFLAFLLLLVALDLTAAARQTGLPRLIGVAGLTFGVLFVAPVSAWDASRYDGRPSAFVTSLQQDLGRLGGQQLSGRVQCIDTTGGCYNALYDSRLLPSTGFLYDEFLFGSERDGVVAASRQSFWNAIQTHPPAVFIVVDRLFPSASPGFAKLGQWPQFNDFLQTHYWLCDAETPPAARWWSREDRPRSYRLYVLRTQPRPTQSPAPAHAFP